MLVLKAAVDLGPGASLLGHCSSGPQGPHPKNKHRRHLLPPSPFPLLPHSQALVLGSRLSWRGSGPWGGVAPGTALPVRPVPDG